MSLGYPPAVQRPPFRRAYRLPFRSPAGVETIIANALADINADDAVGVASVSEIPNSGLGGTGFDYDTVLGAAANGKPHPSGRVLFFGTAGTTLSSPNSAAASITSSLATLAYIAPDDWTPGELKGVVGKWEGTGSQRSYRLRIATNGTLESGISADGGVETPSVSTVATGFTNATGHWVLWVWNNAANTSNYYTSNDPENTPPLDVSWSQLGDPDVAQSFAGVKDSTAILEVGATDGASGRFVGTISTAQVYSGGSVTGGIFSGGTLKTDMIPADHTDPASATFTSSTTGEVYTLTVNCFIENTGHKALQSIGSYGLETTAGQDIAVFTRFIVGRFTDAAPGANQVIFDARSDSAKSVSLFSDNANSNKLTLDAGGTPIAIAGAYDTDLHVFTVISNGADSLLRVSGVGEVEGNPGSEVLDYGTILAALGSGSSAPFSYNRDLTFDSELSGATIAQIEDALSQEYNGVQV